MESKLLFFLRSQAPSSPIVSAFVFAGLAFVGSFLFQVFVWRVFRPRRQIFSLAAVYLVCPVPLFLFLPPALLGAALLLYGSACCAYIMTFPAIQARSPSTQLLLWVWRKGGASAQEIIAALSSKGLIEDRKNDLSDDGLASKDGQSLPWAGWLIATFFRVYRNLMRISNTG
jgi:predicted permease